jgi:hypothetical protein
VVALIQTNTTTADKYSSSSSSSISTSDKLRLYGYYKHVTNDGQGPGHKNWKNGSTITGAWMDRAVKYQAWNSCRDLTVPQDVELVAASAPVTRELGRTLTQLLLNEYNNYQSLTEQQLSKSGAVDDLVERHVDWVESRSEPIGVPFRGSRTNGNHRQTTNGAPCGKENDKAYQN